MSGLLSRYLGWGLGRAAGTTGVRQAAAPAAAGARQVHNSVKRAAAEQSQAKEAEEPSGYFDSSKRLPLANELLKAIPRNARSTKTRGSAATDKIFLNAMQKPRAKFATSKSMFPTSASSASNKAMSFAGVLGSVLSASKTAPTAEMSKQQQAEQEYKQFLNHKAAVTDISGTAGRSFEVSSPRMLGASLGRLNRVLRQNKVREQQFSYRVYERPCHKRQRLRKEERQKKFDAGFRRMLSLVNMARAQGY
ncbi:mitochondrial 37S ribosomal protein bS21m [Dipodascopsis tothii]|uniref:mitochondrial 37S ribosomal protein bS21m n=1 Tax=Dipodascopsis tothii TaxID=44089 RepID=UPI0034CE8BA5